MRLTIEVSSPWFKHFLEKFMDFVALEELSFLVLLVGRKLDREVDGQL